MAEKENDYVEMNYQEVKTYYAQMWKEYYLHLWEKRKIGIRGMTFMIIRKCLVSVKPKEFYTY